jgi:hypothetical protein
LAWQQDFQEVQSPRTLSVGGWTVCRFHGARGGGPKGERNGAYRNGLHTVEVVAERREVAELLRRAREVVG